MEINLSQDPAMPPLAFYVGAIDLNSGLQTYTTGALTHLAISPAYLIYFLHVFGGIKLRSLCLHGKHFTN